MKLDQSASYTIAIPNTLILAGPFHLDPSVVVASSIEKVVVLRAQTFDNGGELIVVDAVYNIESVPISLRVDVINALGRSSFFNHKLYSLARPVQHDEVGSNMSWWCRMKTSLKAMLNKLKKGA